MLRSLWLPLHKKLFEKLKLKFITWFHSKFPGKYCWADCVSWSFSPYRFNPFKVDSTKACEIESINHSTGGCYCGNWSNGKCWDKLSVQEKEEFINNNKSMHPDDLPF